MADNLPEGTFFARPKSDEEKQREASAGVEPLAQGVKFKRPAGEEEPVGQLKDVGMGAASGLTKGVIGLPGMVGGIGQIYDMAGAKKDELIASAAENLGLLPKGKTAEDLLKSTRKLESSFQTPAEQAGYVNKIYGIPFPTPSGSIKAAEDIVAKTGANISPLTQYEAKTGPGRIAQGTTEFIPSALAGPGGILSKLATGSVGGLTGQTAKEIARQSNMSPGYQTFWETLGTVLGSGAISAGLSRYAAKDPAKQLEMAQRFAGQGLRESVKNPSQIQTDLQRRSALAARPGALPTDVQLTPAQLLKSGELQNLQQRLMGLAPNSPEANALQQQIIASKNAMQSSAEQVKGIVEPTIPTTNMSSAIGLSGDNPQNLSSIAARGAFDALHTAKKSASDLAWENPLLKQTNVYKDRALNLIKEHLDDIGLTDRSRIDPEVTNLINTFEKSKGSTIPLMDVQNLRAMVGDKSRRAYASNEPALGKIHKDLATKLHDILADSPNMQFGDTAGAKFAAWDQARAATKDYYDTFRPDFMGKLAAKNAGAPVISSEAVFDNMFSGRNAARNLQETRSALGTSIDPHVSDWIMGDLTKNGTKLDIKQSDVSRYLADPKNAAIVDQVPGLRDRLTNLAQKAGESEQQALVRNAKDAFGRIAESGNPQRISDFLSTHGDLLKSTLTNPNERQFIDSIQRAANLMAPAQAGISSYSKTLNALENGRMIDVILGNKIGILSDYAAGEILSQLFSVASGVQTGIGTGAGFIAAGKTLLGGGQASNLADAVSKVILGDVKGLTVQQLQKAAADPELMRLLMSKPSSEVAMNLHKRLMAMGLGIEQVHAVENKPDQNRRVRASGGRISTSSLGDKLVLAAERAKKENSKATEPLLNVNDESIAKALEIANRNL